MLLLFYFIDGVIANPLKLQTGHIYQTYITQRFTQNFAKFSLEQPTKL